MRWICRRKIFSECRNSIRVIVVSVVIRLSGEGGRWENERSTGDMSDLTRGLWVRISNALYREEGQALTEYALVIALLAVVATIVTAATGVGSTIVNKISVELAKIS